MLSNTRSFIIVKCLFQQVQLGDKAFNSWGKYVISNCYEAKVPHLNFDLGLFAFLPISACIACVWSLSKITSCLFFKLIGFLFFPPNKKHLQVLLRTLNFHKLYSSDGIKEVQNYSYNFHIYKWSADQLFFYQSLVKQQQLTISLFIAGLIVGNRFMFDFMLIFTSKFFISLFKLYYLLNR